MLSFKVEGKENKKSLLSVLFEENPELKQIFSDSQNIDEVYQNIRKWIGSYFELNKNAYKFYISEHTGRKHFNELTWRDYAAIRILDYLDHPDLKVNDLNLRGKEVFSGPFNKLWLEFNQHETDITADFVHDMIYLFRQYNGTLKRHKPSKETVMSWMERHPSGLEKRVIAMREKNKDRIIRKLIEKIDSGEKNYPRFQFDDGKTFEEKYEKMLEWWDDKLFHLRFAIRTPKLLNEMLDHSLGKETMKILKEAKAAGIPTFVNPYYLSLLNIDEPEFARGSDKAIRQYVLFSQDLVDEFGEIVAWEKEDVIKPGKPNVAGWLLPRGNNIHRRYPDVSILIPDTMGRTCGGLCASCQRMYDFQRGYFNFDLEKLLPREKWPDKLARLMMYFEEDTQLRDILITGGDALMSSDKTLKKMLNAVYKMAKRKIEDNKSRPDGKKYAEMVRIRLGTRLPVYLPQRITPELISILSDFKKKASKIGIKQFFIQTHYESAMEVTPESKLAVEMLLSAGWIVTNQQVFTSGTSKRGHTAKLRKVLNDIGVLPYYTFTVKGYFENRNNFATNERAMQEQIEEKVIGNIPVKYYDEISKFAENAENMIEQINHLRALADLPFLATDRNVLNLPGVGKSLTYRTIGVTSDGRRILEFDHDHTRAHSPIIKKMGKIIIVESKSVSKYLRQMEFFGENIKEYEAVFGYSIGETEPRMPIYEYPGYSFGVTEEFTNLELKVED